MFLFFFFFSPFFSRLFSLTILTLCSGDFGFNGIKTIERKTRLALEAGLGGVMIWESGQDCRVNPVTRGGTTHGTTCPKGEESSLLRAIFRTVAAWNSNRQKDEL